MRQDPIIIETRELRNQYAAMFNFDADAIFEDILKRQDVSKRKRVRFSARKPEERIERHKGYMFEGASNVAINSL